MIWLIHALALIWDITGGLLYLAWKSSLKDW